MKFCGNAFSMRFKIRNHTRFASSFIDKRFAPECFDEKSILVEPNFLKLEEGNVVMEEISQLMRRRRYEKGHWDSVISNYKEIEYHGSEKTENIIRRVRKYLETSYFEGKQVDWLPTHAIDMKSDGVLSAHVDSIKFSGEVVAGVSLESSAIMRLKPSREDDDSKVSLNYGYVDMLLPPLSLYGE